MVDDEPRLGSECVHRIFLTCCACVWLGCTGSSSEAPSTPTSPATALPALPDVVKPVEPPRGTPRDPIDVRIALVGEVRGELEPCGCPTVPFGGFGRRGRLLDQLRSKGPLFHLDAGELVMKGFATDRARDLERRARATLALSRTVGVDLWVPGPSDLLALGMARIQQAKGPRRISATWLGSDGQPLLPPTAVLEKGGVRIGIVGLSAAPIGDAAKTVTMRDPVEAARAGLALLPADTDLNIALGNVVDKTAAEVAAQVDGLAAVLTVRGGQYDEPTADHRSGSATPVVEVPDRGRYVQFLTVRVGTDAGASVLLSPEARSWRERESRGDGAEPAIFSDLGSGRNLGYATAIPLGRDLDGNGPVERVLARFKDTSLAEAARRAAQTPGPTERIYASSGGCVHCHSTEFARWSLSGHAKAWQALLTRQQIGNPECLPCHTTAWGEPTGLGELTDTAIRKFKGVQCESCHGPMGGHPRDQRVHAEPITPGTCTGCHDPANSPNFSYAPYLAQATCQGGSPFP
jgi:hypothetical protein